MFDRKGFENALLGAKSNMRPNDIGAWIDGMGGVERVGLWN